MNGLTAVFSTVLELSVTLLAVLVVVVALRFFLLRTGLRRVAYGLWAVVGMRLIFPWSLPSPLSLFNLSSAKSLQEGMTPALQTAQRGGVPAQPALSTLPPQITQTAGGLALPQISLLELLALAWLLGAIAFLLFGFFSYVCLHRRLATAVWQEGRIWQSEAVDSPFVLGLLRPRIYLPLGLSGQERDYVLLHEQTHLHRGDLWVKLVAYLLLAVYWFHPGVWLAWFCLGRDMEMSCDEAVLRRLGGEGRTAYSRTLLSLATTRRLPAPNPVAFGEHDATARIKHVLQWKQSAPAVTFLAVALCILVAAVCGTDAMEQGNWIKRTLGARVTLEQLGGEGVAFDIRTSSQVGEITFYQESYRDGQREEDVPFLNLGVGGEATTGKVELRSVPDFTTGTLAWTVNHGGAVAWNEAGRQLFEGTWQEPTGERRYSSSLSLLGDGNVRKQTPLESNSDTVLMAWFFMENGDEKPYTCQSITEYGAAEAAAVFDRVVLLRMKLTPMAAKDGGWIESQGLSSGAGKLLGGTGRISWGLSEKVQSLALYEETYFQGGRQAGVMLADDFETGVTTRQGSWEVEGLVDMAIGQVGWRVDTDGTLATFPSGGQTQGNLRCNNGGMNVWDSPKKWPLQADDDVILMAWGLNEQGAVTELTCQSLMQGGLGQAVQDYEKLILLRLRFSTQDSMETTRQIETGVVAQTGELAQKLYASKTPYVGEATAMGQLLEVLRMGDWGRFTMQLDTKAQPYAMQIDFASQPNDRDALDRALWEKGCLLLAHVGNLEEVRWSYPWIENGEETLITNYLPLAAAEEQLGSQKNAHLSKYSSLKDCVDSPRSIQNLLDYLDGN